jgi:hypothetical protein
MENLKEKYENLGMLILPRDDDDRMTYFLNEENTGTGFPLGRGENGYIDNTAYQAYQLAFAFAISKHPSLEKLAKEALDINHNLRCDMKSEEIQQFCDNLAKELIDKRVLNGMKILDFGCGEIPTFASGARKLGAESYTIDIVDPSRILEEKYKKEILDYHIFLDLNDKNALEIIKDRTGGEFDLTTASCIYTGGGLAEFAGRGVAPGIQDMALSLTKKGGFYFLPDYPTLWKQK